LKEKKFAQNSVTEALKTNSPEKVPEPIKNEPQKEEKKDLMSLSNEEYARKKKNQAKCYCTLQKFHVKIEPMKHRIL